MDPIIEEFTLTLKYQVSVDVETGNMTTKCISRKVDKSNFEVSEEKAKRKIKPKKEESSEPTLTLEDNKYCLNQAAIELMQIEPECKLDIKYEKQGKNTIPIIEVDNKQGNRLTKSLTVACRGSKNSELSKYGTEFILVPNDSREGSFILQNKDIQIEQSNEEEVELPIDLDLQDIIDNSNVTEINSSLFKL